MTHPVSPFFRLRPSPALMTRLVDDLECVLSVLLAILLAHLIGARNVSWAAFSGYMVMRGHVLDSLRRGALRVAGTLAAAAWPLASLAGAVIGGASLYGALTRRHSYAWLFVGLTFEMILMDQQERPGLALGDFALTRVVEVVAGTAACVAVSTVSALTLRRHWPGARVAWPAPYDWQPQAFRHALQGAAALALLPPLGHLVAIHQLAQSAISIMAVMLVPVSSIAAGGLGPVSRKIGLRMSGCLAGGLLAGLVLYAARGSAPLLVAGTAAGVFAGRHIENGRHTVAYLGTQFTLAVLVTLVPDSYADAAVGPALDRLYSIVVGLVLLEPVLIAWHLAGPRAAPAPAPALPTDNTGQE